jgi:hypothetical protein
LHDGIDTHAAGRRYNRRREKRAMRNLLMRLAFGFLCAALPVVLGCATAQQEVELPPQTLTEAPTSTAEQEAALVSSGHPVEDEVEDPLDDDSTQIGDTDTPTEEGKKDAEPTGRQQTIVIQAGKTADVTPLTLQQASASERERRAASDVPVAVITNRNLSDLAEGGQITVIGEPEPAAPTGAPAGGGGEQGAATTNSGAATAAPGTATTATAASSTAPVAAAPAKGAPDPGLAEEYWRGQALKIRLDWKAAVEEVDELQTEVADLRRRFYEEDDPFYRDNEIKPAWDRALDRLQEAKAAAETQERKLSRFLEEGRKSGALPGWLREGMEFEPPATADHSPAQRRRTDDPWEPKVLDEEPRDP